jgi:hypothetical protein
MFWSNNPSVDGSVSIIARLVGIRPQELNVGVPVDVGRYGHHVESRHRGRRRVRPVRRVRDQYLMPPGVASCQVVCLDHQDPAQLALRPRRRRQADRVHTSDLEQRVLQFVKRRQCPLHRLGRLLRVRERETGVARDILVDLRVVLHRYDPNGQNPVHT